MFGDTDNDSECNKTVNTSEEVMLFQSSLFEPTGKFRSNAIMDIYYHIESGRHWTSMTRYYSFIRKPLISLAL